MSLSEVWFVLFVAIIAGYLIGDGFDIGVGILHPFVAKSDAERRVLLNSIGPVWDGNEVWLVLGGGVLFAAFPLVYASLFSGFYIAFMLVLLVLILRTVAIEFRSKETNPQWRRIWDLVFALASGVLALLLGLAFGNIVEGVNLNASGDISISLRDLLSPYAVLVGITAISMFAMHGALFLALKTGGELHQRLRRAIPRLMAAFFVLTTATVVATAVLRDTVRERYTSDPWLLVFPAAALLAFVLAWRLSGRGLDLRAFAASGATIAMLLSSGAAGLYPNLLLSSSNKDYSLTVHNAAAASNTLTVMLIFAIIGMPLVLLYTAGVYFFFRGKTELGPDSY